MKERPILFSAPMVRAILEGRKTQTRRIVKPIPQMVGDKNISTWEGDAGQLMRLFDQVGRSCPYGHSGDRLWVREAFSGPHYQSKCPPKEWSDSDPIWYWADGNPESGDWTKPKPSIHMPRWASRILLEVTDARIERLQDISDRDSIEEGILSVRSQRWDLENFKEWRMEFDEAVSSGKKPPIGPSPKAAFSALWESINGSGSWAANPWVWIIGLKRVQP